MLVLLATYALTCSLGFYAFQLQHRIFAWSQELQINDRCVAQKNTTQTEGNHRDS